MEGLSERTLNEWLFIDLGVRTSSHEQCDTVCGLALNSPNRDRNGRMVNGQRSWSRQQRSGPEKIPRPPPSPSALPAPHHSVPGKRPGRPNGADGNAVADDTKRI